ncbi:MAG TPA: hypothetical protein VII82_07705 [Polyangiaceae bacterium]|jgi:hypothetical protein
MDIAQNNIGLSTFGGAGACLTDDELALVTGGGLFGDLLGAAGALLGGAATAVAVVATAVDAPATAAFWGGIAAGVALGTGFELLGTFGDGSSSDTGGTLPDGGTDAGGGGAGPIP